MQKGFFQNQAQNCSAFFKKKLGDNGNPIVKLFTETYLSKKVCCFIFHTADAPVQTITRYVVYNNVNFWHTIWKLYICANNSKIIILF